MEINIKNIVFTLWLFKSEIFGTLLLFIAIALLSNYAKVGGKI